MAYNLKALKLFPANQKEPKKKTYKISEAECKKRVFELVERQLIQSIGQRFEPKPVENFHFDFQ